MSLIYVTLSGSPLYLLHHATMPTYDSMHKHRRFRLRNKLRLNCVRDGDTNMRTAACENKQQTVKCRIS